MEHNDADLTAAILLAETYEKIGDIDIEKSKSYYDKSVEIWRERSANNSLVPEEKEKMNRVILKLEKANK